MFQFKKAGLNLSKILSLIGSKLNQYEIGFYATPTGHTKFAEELSVYKQEKGSVQFPINQPIPYELIKKIVVCRVKENEQ